VLRRISPVAKADIIDHLGPALTTAFPAGAITTDLRAAHLLAQAATRPTGSKPWSNMAAPAISTAMTAGAISAIASAATAHAIVAGASSS
ncbi:hypothetical protein, partial [Serratia marcescens]|uniref:hypothetical protein n=1 Tax=Serratia marcescens TaxID=615 RepID=UPI0013DA956E